MPGTALTPTRQDNRIPLILIRRTLETPGAESRSIDGYTLLLPAGWSMALWNSLTYTGTRVGGQRERQTQAYEAGTAYFPRDYPSSSAYKEWAARKASEERTIWLRKPPAKRVNYDKLGVRSPWQADWEVVLGLKKAEPFIRSQAEVKSMSENKGKGKRKGKDKSEKEFTTTQRDDRMGVNNAQFEDEVLIDMSKNMEVCETEVKPWLFRGSDVIRIFELLQGNPGSELLAEINQLRRKRSFEPLDSLINGDELLNHALVNVKIIMFKEGVPEDMAMIYRVSDEEATMWEQSIAGNKTAVTSLQVVLEAPLDMMLDN